VHAQINFSESAAAQHLACPVKLRHSHRSLVSLFERLHHLIGLIDDFEHSWGHPIFGIWMSVKTLRDIH